MVYFFCPRWGCQRYFRRIIGRSLCVPREFCSFTSHLGKKRIMKIPNCPQSLFWEFYVILFKGGPGSENQGHRKRRPKRARKKPEKQIILVEDTPPKPDKDVKYIAEQYKVSGFISVLLVGKTCMESCFLVLHGNSQRQWTIGFSWWGFLVTLLHARNKMTSWLCKLFANFGERNSASKTDFEVVKHLFLKTYIHSLVGRSPGFGKDPGPQRHSALGFEWNPITYSFFLQVPDDFDPSILHPVATEPKQAFIREFAEAFLERWLILRCNVRLLTMIGSRNL